MQIGTCNETTNHMNKLIPYGKIPKFYPDDQEEGTGTPWTDDDGRLATVFTICQALLDCDKIRIVETYPNWWKDIFYYQSEFGCDQDFDEDEATEEEIKAHEEEVDRMYGRVMENFYDRSNVLVWEQNEDDVVDRFALHNDFTIKGLRNRVCGKSNDDYSLEYDQLITSNDGRFLMTSVMNHGTKKWEYEMSTLDKQKNSSHLKCEPSNSNHVVDVKSCGELACISNDNKFVIMKDNESSTIRFVYL